MTRFAADPIPESLPQRLLDCFYSTYNEMGFGLPESLYSAGLEIVLADAGISARREHMMEMCFRGRVIGSYRLDFLVEDAIVLELKAGALLAPGARSQLLTYLRVAGKRQGYVLFFGPSPEVKRVLL